MVVEKIEELAVSLCERDGIARFEIAVVEDGIAVEGRIIGESEGLGDFFARKVTKGVSFEFVCGEENRGMDDVVAWVSFDKEESEVFASGFDAEVFGELREIGMRDEVHLDFGSVIKGGEKSDPANRSVSE